jgi:threonyl-tRNA synthetase
MNCPGHIQVFNSGLRSYKDLPVRFGEFGACHRNESSGSLHGIMRVRGFVQDDGHVFCTEEQIQAECLAHTRLLQKVYKDFGFTDVIYKLSTRPAMRIGSEESWDLAEKALADALNGAGVQWEELKGEGAFYGPKIEYSLKDSLGRVWQCGTIQVDPNMPARLGAEYVTDTSGRKTPIMLHRAIVGSLERFIGILIENHAGALPAWLSPDQVVVMCITDHQSEYAANVAQTLKKQGFRVKTDLRNEKINYKIRENSLQKVPYLLICGEKEREAGTVAVRARGGLDLGVMSVEAFVDRLQSDVSSKA